jgi:quercetin dioxygenase-like cupin family protein
MTQRATIVAAALVGILATALVGATAALAAADSQAPAMPAGITRAQLVDNATVLIARLGFAPGAREEVHTHPFSAIVIQFGAGDVDMRLGPAHTTGRREHGYLEYIAGQLPHAARNTGAAPFEVVTVAIKADRTPGGEQPAAAAPPGITRTPVLDNADARVTRVAFAAGAREPVHSHPFDLVVVPLTPGRMEVRLGREVAEKAYAAGEAMFLPRDVPHAVSNVDGRVIAVYSIGIK